VAYQILTAELDSYRAVPHHDLCQLVGDQSSRIVRGQDGVDYRLTVAVPRSPGECDIRVKAQVGMADWGGPHDVLEDEIVIKESTVT
jgi:hypothetical protein